MTAKHDLFLSLMLNIERVQKGLPRKKREIQREPMQSFASWNPGSKMRNKPFQSFP